MGRHRPDLSVVVPTHRRAEHLARLLDSLEQQRIDGGTGTGTGAGGEIEVIVVNDQPDPETEQLLRQRSESGGLRLRHLRREQAPGSAPAARNIGWRAAEAPLIAFIDDDCRATPEWAGSYLASAGEWPGDVLQGPTRPDPADSANASPYSHTQSISELGPWFQTCNIAYPRELLERLDGFDEYFRRAGEDADLAWRAFTTGARARFVPEAGVLHAVIPQTPRRALRFATRDIEAALAYKRHPELRRVGAYRRFFWKRTHARLLLALLGLALAASRGPAGRLGALLLAAPYAKGLLGRTRTAGGGPDYVAFLLVYDALDVATALRSSARHRILLI